jgi:hypothetical protein
MVPPSDDDVARPLAFGRGLTAKPRNDAHLPVHCHAGISRSTASMALLLTQALPVASADEVMLEIARIQHTAWPNLPMIEISDDMSSRNGESLPQVVTKSDRLARSMAELLTTESDLSKRGIGLIVSSEELECRASARPIMPKIRKVLCSWDMSERRCAGLCRANHFNSAAVISRCGSDLL